MKIFRSAIFLVSFVIVISCNSKNSTIIETGVGRIIVNSNVEKGEIFVDGDFSGQFTSDTLELLAVNHFIKVRKEGYFSEERQIEILKDETISEEFNLQKNELFKNVLVEVFTNSDCDSSLVTNDIFSLIEDKYKKRVIIINYPSRFSNQNDPMYLEVNEEVDSRMSFYNILEIPTFIIDGNNSSPTDQVINENLLKETKLLVALQDSIIQGDAMTIDVFVDVFDLDGIEFSSLVLYTAIIENNIIYKTPPGSNGQIEFMNILRRLIPDFEGISLASINKKGRAKFAEVVILNPKWKKENLRVVSFVQNKLTREILQVGGAE